jgi:hypothetical protein
MMVDCRKLWMFLVLLLVVAAKADNAAFGTTSRFMRKLAESIDLPYDSPYFTVPPGDNPPQQVHLTQGDFDGKAVIVSYVTVKPTKPKVYYGKTSGMHPWAAQGYSTQYQFYNYTSGFIHHVVIAGLEFNTKYYYKIGHGTDGAREFFFTTPPAPGPDTPYTFGAIGDLGQTYDSAATLEHYLQSYGQAVLYLGDLAYQDNYPFHYQVRYDTWSRFVERSAAYQPYLWTSGNHELDYVPEIGETVPFKPFNHRFPTPYWATNSTSPQWYAVRRGPAHIIVLSSYSAYGKYTPQYVWLQAALKAVDRTVTPWLIVLVHSPWYNSYNYHYMEGETMRVIFEPFIVAAKVDVVFAGHVHAYERSYPVSNIKYNITNGICTPQVDPTAPTYITIGDGGNIEGLAANYTQPQPNYSAFREASFGHGLFDIKNRTTAVWTWHRNQDGEAVSADSIVLKNKIFG